MSLPRVPRLALPLQVAAVCYRRVNSHAEFLLVDDLFQGFNPLVELLIDEYIRFPSPRPA